MINKDAYRVFCADTAAEWGKKYYGNWLFEMQNQDNMPQTPAEKFFRYYTQGINHTFSRVLRSGCDIEKYCVDSILSPEMFYDAIDEINSHPVQEDIVVFRYIDKETTRSMLKWGNLLYFKKGSIIFDKTFLSTTLTPETVQSRDYARNYRRLLKIFVPKGTPCLYLELIADMQENEVLFAPNLKLRVLSLSLDGVVECVAEWLDFRESFMECGGSIKVIHGDQEIGGADIHIHNRHIKINSLGINDEYKNRGAGKALMRYIMWWCDKNKILSAIVRACSGITLEMRELGIKGLTQEELIRFYESFGFVRCGDYELKKDFNRFCLLKPKCVF